MRFAAATLLLLLGADAPAGSPQAAAPAAASSPSPSPSPTPLFKLAPYGFEAAQDRSPVPLLRFEERTEVQALEMNAAMARFLDSGDEKTSTRRGAAPGGAPTLSQMRQYRPHVTEGLNFLGLAALLGKEVGSQFPLRRRNSGEEVLRELLLATASPTPTPSPTPR
jgi:hypothetical protein